MIKTQHGDDGKDPLWSQEAETLSETISDESQLQTSKQEHNIQIKVR